MGLNHHFGKTEPNPPFLDEGWWESLLSENDVLSLGSTEKEIKNDESTRQVPDWHRALSIYEQDDIIQMVVCGHNRGGLLVEGHGLTGFVPCSHLLNMQLHANDNERELCLSAYEGHSLRLKIIECHQQEGRLVFSERAALAEAGKRPELFNKLTPGCCLQGEVTNVTDFGVFIDLGGAEGLIHISELSWGRVVHPGQICQVGQHLEVQVMEISSERHRIALSLKRLHPNPWKTAHQKYPLNGIVPATVTTLVPYGAFALLEEGLEGLIHTSEIPLPPQAGIADVLTPGQTVLVRILLVDCSRQRMGLSMKLE